MSWILILVAILVVFLLGYILFPAIKKMFSGNQGGESNAPSGTERQRSKEIRRAERANKKQKSKPEKSKSKDNKNVEVIQNQGDFFAEPVPEVKEDPDTKVDYDNFDLDGLFEKNDESLKEIKKEELPGANNIYSDNFNELFDDDFSVFDDVKPNLKRREFKNSDFFKPNKVNFDFESDDEINDLFRENNIVFSDETDLKKQMDSLSPEMKALFLSKVLDKKEDD